MSAIGKHEFIPSRFRSCYLRRPSTIFFVGRLPDHPTAAASDATRANSAPMPVARKARVTTFSPTQSGTAFEAKNQCWRCS
jgi:hypothetical protein